MDAVENTGSGNSAANSIQHPPVGQSKIFLFFIFATGAHFQNVNIRNMVSLKLCW